MHDGISGDGTSADQTLNGGFQRKHVNEEESEDEDYPRTMG